MRGGARKDDGVVFKGHLFDEQQWVYQERGERKLCCTVVSFLLSVSLCHESFNFLLVSCDLEPKNQSNANKAVLAVAGTWLTASSNCYVSLCACVCVCVRTGPVWGTPV